jgi:hypothetical protein
MEQKTGSTNAHINSFFCLPGEGGGGSSGGAGTNQGGAGTDNGDFCGFVSSAAAAAAGAGTSSSSSSGMLNKNKTFVGTPSMAELCGSILARAGVEVRVQKNEDDRLWVPPHHSKSSVLDEDQEELRRHFFASVWSVLMYASVGGIEYFVDLSSLLFFWWGVVVGQRFGWAARCLMPTSKLLPVDLQLGGR